MALKFHEASSASCGILATTTIADNIPPQMTNLNTVIPNEIAVKLQL